MHMQGGLQMCLRIVTPLLRNPSFVFWWSQDGCKLCFVEERDCLSHWGTDALLSSLINPLLPTIAESGQWNFRLYLFRSIILYLIRSNTLFENKFFVIPSFLAWYHVMDIITHLHIQFQKVLTLTKLLRQVQLFLDPYLGKSRIKPSPSQLPVHPVGISLQPKYPICLIDAHFCHPSLRGRGILLEEGPWLKFWFKFRPYFTSSEVSLGTQVQRRK